MIYLSFSFTEPFTFFLDVKSTAVWAYTRLYPYFFIRALLKKNGTSAMFSKLYDLHPLGLLS